jgi:queuine tRNA-ribosyltransferase
VTVSHKVIKYENGEHSLVECGGGQAMHSAVGPWTEARVLYSEQSELVSRLSISAREPLILYDVGMGIAANALASIEAASQITAKRKLTIISFENDLRGAHIALDNLSLFPFVERHQAKIRSLLEQRHWCSDDGLIEWRLCEGEFFELVATEEEPELVFYDFYSPKSCPELWTSERFGAIYAKTCARREAHLDTLLLTYTAATRVRAALLRAGFFVGYGATTDKKSDTTVAATSLEALGRPLDSRWAERLLRSPSIDKAELHELSAHPQLRPFFERLELNR